MSETADSKIRIEVDAEGLRAYVRLEPAGDYRGVDGGQLLEALKAAGIEISEAVVKRSDEVAALLRAGKRPEEGLVVAEGSPASDGCDGRLEWAEGLDPTIQPINSEDGRVNFYEWRRMVTIEPEAVIGRIVSAVPPRAGVDVYGKSIEPARRRPTEVQLGENVRLAEDGRTVIATAAGHVEYRDGKVSVLPVLQIKGDVNFATGNVEATTEVLIEGGVQDLFVVRSKKAVTVQGQVGASTLEANGDIVVEGGIAGKDKAKLRTGGKLSAKFCDAATVRASDDVVILKEVINSKIHTDGRLRIMRGALIGGCVHARNGIEVRTLGSSAGVKTTVSVGMDPRLCQQIAKLDLQISKRREAAERVRALVKPLLPELKGLAGWQRQRASQLLGEVRQLDRAVRELQEQRQQLVDWGRATREPAVTVTSQIHPGVTVIVDGLASTFDQPRKGHVKLVKRCIDNQMELVAVDQLSGSVTVLPSYRYRAERS